MSGMYGTGQHARPVDRYRGSARYNQSHPADKSQSRLMTLPKELRNKIYEFVFCDNITHIHELITYQRKAEANELVSTPGMKLEDTGVEAIFAYVPRPVPLDRTTPPSKESILPCRQLYAEMRKMQIAAHRAYWLKNRFVHTGTIGTTLPADKDIMRIEGFLIVLASELNLHIAFNWLGWTSWLLLPQQSKTPGAHDLESWFVAQMDLIDTVEDHVSSTLHFSRRSGELRKGEGLTRDMLVMVPRLRGVADEVDVVRDLLRTTGK